MIEIQDKRPRNGEHVYRLLAFCQQILALCETLDITPVLSGSLAVFGYTQDQTMNVNDVDLACSERLFGRLGDALEARGLACEQKPYHVLRVHQGDLKVEFDSLEYWMAGLPDEYDTLRIGGCTFCVVSLAGLKELYRRGLEATAKQQNPADCAKHASIRAKYASLCAL